MKATIGYKPTFKAIAGADLLWCNDISMRTSITNVRLSKETETFVRIKIKEAKLDFILQTMHIATAKTHQIH